MKTTIPAALFVLTVTGCSQSLFTQSFFNSTVMEDRVVQQFTDAVAEENESALRLITSTRFEEKAMSSDDALTDLGVVRLPTGDVNVVEVTEAADGRREVIVKEESGGKYQFQLVRDESKGYWVVDDVLVRQKGKGTRTAKSTTEIMDLLQTLRTFLDVWADGSKEQILAMTSPELSETLRPLQEGWLKALTSQTASVYEEGMARKPEANLTDNDAVVKLPARNGHLMMKIVRSDNGWLIDDVEVHNHRDDSHAGSVRRQADAINTVTQFLAAYQDADRTTLQSLTHRTLYEGSLKIADLSLIELPTANSVPSEFSIRAYESRLTCMLPFGQEVVRFDLKERTENKDAEFLASRFEIEEVTLYEQSTQRQRSLSAVFTAPSRASLFLKALADRDPKILSHVSSANFSRATWKRGTSDILRSLQFPNFYADGITVTDSHDVSDMTELEFTNSAGMVFSCRMVNQNGGLKVDDVQYPNDKGQITSLRTQLELAVPVLEFADAWEQNNLPLVQRACSSDFNRLVWSHLEGVPQQFSGLSTYLRMPTVETQVTLERATVRLQAPDSQNRVSANLISEHGFWVIDEIKLEAAAGKVVDLRANLRRQIASRLLNGSYSTVHTENGDERIMPIASERQDPLVRQASNVVSTPSMQGRVSHALYERQHGDDETEFHEGQVSPAVQFDEIIGREPATHNKKNGIVTAGYNRPAAKASNATTLPATTESGIQVFGPAADAVANAMARKSHPLALDTPIDMTEDTPTTAAQDATAGIQNADAADVRPDSNEAPGLMYFGPNEKQLSSGSAIREPADAPIPFD